MPAEAPGRTITQDGKTALFFSGYSYLGMSHVPTFTDLLKEGIDRYGALFPSSRASNTPLPLYANLEHYLSLLTGQADTVTYASGFMACQALGHLLRDFGQVLVAPGTHPATGLVDTTGAGRTGASGQGEQNERDRANNPADAAGPTWAFDAWTTHVLDYTRTSSHDHFILVTDSVSPLTGAIHDYMWLQDLPRHKHFTVVIDDSHGIGWMGEHGEGIASALMHLPHVEYLLVYSLAKALHVQGGAVSCPAVWADRLRRGAHFTAGTAMAPAFAHTLLHAGTLYEVQRARLEANIPAFARRAQNRVITTGTPIFPCTRPGTAGALAEKGIIISAFAYPNPDSPPIERIVLSALHEEEDLKKLAEAL